MTESALPVCAVGKVQENEEKQQCMPHETLHEKERTGKQSARYLLYWFMRRYLRK